MEPEYEPETIIENASINETNDELIQYDVTMESVDETSNNFEEDIGIASPSITPNESPTIEEENNVENTSEFNIQSPADESYYDHNGTLHIFSQTLDSTALMEDLTSKSPLDKENKTTENNEQPEEEVHKTQELVNFPDEFERQELEMQLGID